MKKYKLQDIVSNGTHARAKVNSDLIVGNISSGYGYGDILDANAVTELIKKALSEQGAIDEELMELIKRKIEEEVNAVINRILEGDIKAEVAAQEITDENGDVYAIEFVMTSQNN